MHHSADVSRARSWGWKRLLRAGPRCQGPQGAHRLCWAGLGPRHSRWCPLRRHARHGLAGVRALGPGGLAFTAGHLTTSSERLAAALASPAYNHQTSTTTRVLRPDHHHAHLFSERLNLRQGAPRRGLTVACGGIIAWARAGHDRAGACRLLAKPRSPPRGACRSMPWWRCEAHHWATGTARSAGAGADGCHRSDFADGPFP